MKVCKINYAGSVYDCRVSQWSAKGGCIVNVESSAISLVFRAHIPASVYDVMGSSLNAICDAPYDPDYDKCVVAKHYLISLIAEALSLFSNSNFKN